MFGWLFCLFCLFYINLILWLEVVVWGKIVSFIFGCYGMCVLGIVLVKCS